MMDATDRLVLREELRKAIKDDTGLDIPRGTMDQWCSPSRGEGPPVKGYLGRRPLYSVKEGIAWALSRVRPEPYRRHPNRPPDQMARV
jgi:hypothetical protein